MTVGDMLYANAKAAPSDSTHHGAPTGEQKSANEDPATATVASTSISGGLPQLFFLQYDVVPLNMETLRIIFPFAIILCGVGLIESLMTLTLIDEITETRGNGNRECVGQGVANLVCGLFGGMGGCAMIGQSLINVNSGGRGRLSGIYRSRLFTSVRPVFCSTHRADSDGGVGGRDVHGCDRDLRMGLGKNVPADASERCVGDDVGDRLHGVYA